MKILKHCKWISKTLLELINNSSYSIFNLNVGIVSISSSSGLVTSMNSMRYEDIVTLQQDKQPVEKRYGQQQKN
jgi:uncharacterized protein (DUF4213/DUF364 family)